MFDATSLLKLGAESFTTATAYIRIKDEREARAFSKKKGEKMGGSALAGGAGVMGQLANKANNAAKSAVTQVTGSGVIGTLGNMIGDKLGLNMNAFTKGDGYDKVFKVQFNPSTLQISSMGGGEIVQKTDYASTDGKGGKVELGTTKAHIEMSVQLLFDSLTENYKAFAADLANFSSTNLINEGLDLVDSVVSEKLLGGNVGIGVQAAVEAFIAAVRNPGIRMVCFEWGDLLYKGELKSVNATYTMFDSVGRPVRAKVVMSIYLEDESVTEKDLGVWEAAYNEVFGGDKFLNMGGSGIGNAAKSIFNI